MFALSTWSESGPPSPSVFAPSNDWFSSGSSPWKLPDAASKPIGAAARWSWNLLTRKKAWVADCLRLICQLERSPTGSQPQMWFGRQRGAPLTVNGVNAKLKSPLSGVTSSVGLRDVVVVDVRPRVRVRAGQVGGGRGQPARRGEVLVAERAAVRGAEVVVEDVPGEALDAVGAPQQAAAGRVDDAVVVLARGRLVVDAPGQPRAGGGAEQRQPRLLAAREGGRAPGAARAALDAHAARQADAALQRAQRGGRGDARRDGGDGEGVPGRAVDAEHAPAAVDRHADAVVEGRDPLVRLAVAQQRQPARRVLALGERERVDVRGRQAERRGVAAQVRARDRVAAARGRSGEGALELHQRPRRVGERVDLQHAGAAQAAPQRRAPARAARRRRRGRALAAVEERPHLAAPDAARGSRRGGCDERAPGQDQRHDNRRTHPHHTDSPLVQTARHPTAEGATWSLELARPRLRRC